MGCSASKDVLDQTQPHHHVQYLSSKIAGGSSVYAKLGRSASTTSLPLRHHHHRRGDNNNNSNVKSPGVVDNTSSCCSSYHVVILTSSSYGLLTMDHHQQQQSLQQHQQQQSLLQYHHHQHLAEKQVENGGGILQVPSTASCQASATDLVVDERMSSADENYLVKNFDIVPAVDLVKVMMMKKKKKKKNPKLLLVSEVDEEVEMPAESINLLELMDGLEEGGGEAEEEDMSEWSAAADFSDQELEISPPVESSPAEEALLQMVVECEEKKPSDHRHDQGTNPLTAAPAPAAGGGSTKLKPSPASTSPGADARQARQAAASKAAAASVRPGLSKPPRYPVKLQPPKLVPAESDSTIAAAKASESSSIGNELETNRQSSATREDHFWTEELECTIHESDGLLEAFERELEQFLNNSKEEEKEEWYCKVGNKSEDGEENSEAAKYHSDQALLLQLPGAADTTTTTTTTKRNKIIEDCGAGKKLQQEGETVVMKAEQPASWEEEDFFWQEADEQKFAPLYTSSTAITSGAVAQGITKIFQDCTHVKFILQRMGISIDELATLVEEEEAGSLPSQNSPREASSL
ncbi:unnamed protein product [Sphagnum jensenii]|uniref:Uncharacterized protein n=2 Tax=Sphagnum jensenii TaxID=128206 RepID=A0ABP0WPL8_9BRYO